MNRGVAHIKLAVCKCTIMHIEIDIFIWSAVVCKREHFHPISRGVQSKLKPVEADSELTPRLSVLLLQYNVPRASHFSV